MASSLVAGPLRILNVVRPAAGVRFLPARPPPVSTPALSLEPCHTCPSLCCRKKVVLGTAEAIRIGFALGVRLRAFIEPVRWGPHASQRLSWPFKLDDGRYVLRFTRPAGACTHLVRPDQPTSRCGIYENRPAVCRLYPFVLADDDERFHMGSQQDCPEQWLQDDQTLAEAADAVARFRKDREHDLQIVRAWNRGRRQRTFPRLLAFLEGYAAAALGEDPDRVARFPG